MFKKPTRFFEELINSNGKGRTVMTALENFTPLIGGIPIIVDGQIVGGGGVSGAATADEDERRKRSSTGSVLLGEGQGGRGVRQRCHLVRRKRWPQLHGPRQPPRKARSGRDPHQGCGLDLCTPGI